MKRNTQFLELKEEILNIPIGPNVKNKESAEIQRDRIIKGENLGSIVIASLLLNDVNLLEFLSKNIDLNNIDTGNDQKDNLLHIAVNGGLEVLQFCLEHTEINPTITNNSNMNILHFAARFGNIKMMEHILKYTEIDPAAVISDGSNILHCATKSGSVEVIEYILKNTSIDPTTADFLGKNILDIAVRAINHTNPGHKDYSKKLEVVKYILEAGIIDKISYNQYAELIQLTQENSPDFSNSINLIKYMLYDKEELKAIDFSKEEFDEDLLLKMFEHYVCIPHLTNFTIGKLKDLVIKKVEDSNYLPKILVDAILDIFSRLAKEILAKECELLNEDYILNNNSFYSDLPGLILHFNPKCENDILGLKKWEGIFPDLEKEFDNFIKSFAFAKDDKNTENKIKLSHRVFDNAGNYLNKLAGLNNGEILKKCIINENFIEHLRSINPIYLKAETKQIFSGIIKKYDEMQNDWGSQVLFNFYKEHVGLIKELVVSKQDITDIEEDIQILGEDLSFSE